MDRLFLDANVLFSAAWRPDGGVARLWRVEEAILQSSDYAVEEATRNLDSTDQVARLERLLESVDLVPSVGLFDASLDGIDLPRKDLPIIGAASYAGSSHLVTGDLRHFGPYRGARLLGVLIVTPADYLNSTS